MNGTIRNQILEQEYLYRGTNEFDFERRKRNGFYYGRTQIFGFSEISTATSLLDAMINGVSRTKTAEFEIRNTKPLLLAIKIRGYTDKMHLGLEEGEIGLDSPVDLKDLVEVRSLEQLLNVCPHIINIEVDYFKRYYQQTVFNPSTRNS